MDLFVRESGPVEAQAVVFLHGGQMSGWSWEPVVERMQRYRCLVPDLPRYGKSFEQGPFEMTEVACAVADVIRSRVAGGRAHLVGYSLGAQVGMQLLATEPGLIDRAVLSGTAINTLPGASLMQPLLGQLARTAWFGRVVKRQWNARDVRIPAADIDAYRQDARLMTGAHLAQIVMASAGFTLPEGLDKTATPALFITGAHEMPLVRGWAAALAQAMPNGIDRIAIGMRHDWPLRYPDLFSRTVDGWLSQTALPPEIAPPDKVGFRRVRVAGGPRRDRSHR